VLKNEYKKNPEWTAQQIDELAEILGLESSKIYKWHWDQKKREVRNAK
jgi:hypothetical protein